MKAKVLIGFAFLMIVCFDTQALDFKIISANDSHKSDVTDTLRSGNMLVGANAYGGGYITQLYIPGIGNIFNEDVNGYGTGQQTAFRDFLHGERYNPTQAGYIGAGTECELIKTPGKIICKARPLAKWRGDGEYDFTRWENIVPDKYPEHIAYGGKEGADDQDNLEEENLEVTVNGIKYTKQEAEVICEFDFYAEYENWMGKDGVTIPCLRTYFEHRYIRPAGHGIAQHGPGTLLFNNAELGKRIDRKYPNFASPYLTTANDIGNMSISWMSRMALALWYPTKRFSRLKATGEWVVDDRTGVKQGDESIYLPYYIVANTTDENNGPAIGYYKPYSEINTHSVMGMKESDGSVYYTDDRRDGGDYYNDSPKRTNVMSWIGFKSGITGMIDRARLPKDIYETFRNEYYILTGTVAEIKAAMLTLDTRKKTQTITFFDLNTVSQNGADYSPAATSNSGLAITYTSSNNDVATIVDGKIKIIGLGSCIITASQSGNTWYKPAINVSRQLNVVSTTSVETPVENKKSFRLISNPAQNEIKITIESGIDKLFIYNVLGKMMYSSNDLKENFLIPTSSLGGSGVYFVTAGNQTEKLLIIK